MKKASSLLEYASFINKNNKSLFQKLVLYPNYGIGVKVTNKYNPSISYIIDSVKLTSAKTANIFGLRIEDNVRDNKITEVFSQNQFKITSVPKEFECVVNGNIFNISEICKKIEEKKRLLSIREEVLGEKSIEKEKEKDKKKVGK